MKNNIRIKSISPGYMTGEQIHELAQDQDICTIGSHMCSHRKTREMSDREIRKEWADSKSILEKITGKPVEHAALPYGSDSKPATGP